MNLDKHMSRFVPEVYFFSGYEPEICLQNYITGITKELLKHKFQSHPWQLKLSLKYEPLTVFQSPTLQTSWRLAAFLNQEVKTSRNPHNSITKNRTRTSRAWSRKTARSTAISHTPSISSQTNRTKKKHKSTMKRAGAPRFRCGGKLTPCLLHSKDPRSRLRRRREGSAENEREMQLEANREGSRCEEEERGEGQRRHLGESGGGGGGGGLGFSRGGQVGKKRVGEWWRLYGSLLSGLDGPWSPASGLH